MQYITDIDKFLNVAPQMVWHGPAVAQIVAFETAVAAFAQRRYVTAEVVSGHKSKSINLPVIKLSTAAGEFTLRDNFHDVNLMAVLKQPSTLTLEQFFVGIQEPLTWDWYLNEVARSRNYSWSNWSDEEMNDPRILRVRDKRAGTSMWWEKKGDEKDRWMRRMHDPAWYSKDWSGGELSWDGVFGAGVKIYRQDRAFAEGITVTTSNRKYTRGVQDFIIATGNLASAMMMVERLHEGV